MAVTTIAVTVALPMYLAIAPLYSRLQRDFAGRGSRRRPPAPPEPFQPDVDVIVPCYNEDPDLLRACLRSLADQDYKGEMRVWVVDDGSRNLSALCPVLYAETGLDLKVVLLDGNKGKREAQATAALHHSTGARPMRLPSGRITKRTARRSSSFPLLPLVHRRLNHRTENPASACALQESRQGFVGGRVFDEATDGPAPGSDVGGDLAGVVHDVGQINEHLLLFRVI